MSLPHHEIIYNVLVNEYYAYKKIYIYIYIYIYINDLKENCGFCNRLAVLDD